MVKSIRSPSSAVFFLGDVPFRRTDSLLLSGQVLARRQKHCHLGLSFTITLGISFFLS